MAAVQYLCVCLIALCIGETVSTLSRARIPSVFVTSLVFLFGYWTVFPANIVERAGIGGPMATIAIAITLVNLGSTFSIKELLQQYRSAVITICGMAGVALVLLTVGKLVLAQEYIIIGLPPFLGGVVAALIMQGAAAAHGLEELSVFAILVFVLQGFLGFPFLSVMLNRESKRLLQLKDAGKPMTIATPGLLSFGSQGNADQDLSENTQGDKTAAVPSYEFSPTLDKFLTTTYSRLMRIAFVASLAYLVSTPLKSGTGIDINVFVICLVFGVLARAIGIIKQNELALAGGAGLALSFIMIYIYDGLSKSTPELVVSMIIPFLILACLGLIGMSIVSIICGKIFGLSPYLSFACAVNALIGFPINYTIVKEVVNAVGRTDEEKAELEHQLMPPILIAGFVSVSIVSVVVAGFFTGLL